MEILILPVDIGPHMCDEEAGCGLDFDNPCFGCWEYSN